MQRETETAIGAALSAKGVTARVVALRTALALFRNHGGTYDEAASELNAAYADDDRRFSTAGRTLSERAVAARTGSEGRTSSAEVGLPRYANASRLDAAKGRTGDAVKADMVFLDAAPERDEAGQAPPAAKASGHVSASARRTPGHARRGAAAIAGVQTTMAKSLFDTYRLPGDDRAIGDVTWKELQGLARRHAEAYRLLSLIDGYGVPADQDSKVRDVLKEDTLREFVEIARLSNVH